MILIELELRSRGCNASDLKLGGYGEPWYSVYSHTLKIKG